MTDEHSPGVDLGTAHLRPAPRSERRSGDEAATGPAALLPWEGRRRRGVAGAFIASWWLLVRSPVAAWALVPEGGGVRRPATFALACGAFFGVISELVDSLTVALLSHDGGAGPVLQLEIAGRSLDWLSFSVLSLAGCLLALVVGVPLFLLLYSLLVILWTTVVHTLLLVSGGLAASGAGYEGTLRAVCYSQAAMAVAVLPWIGDLAAILCSCGLQIVGLVRLHRCSGRAAAVAVGLLLAAAITALVLLILLAKPGG